MKSEIARFVVALCAMLAFSPLHGQSCCDNDNTTTLCYLSASEFCISNAENCAEYSIDGGFMENGLTMKLNSPDNYGANGIVPCNLELVKLSPPITVQAINDTGCDIVFVPPIPLDPVTLFSDGTQTFMPQDALDAIREWSVICDNNLVVVTQGETQTWGYTLENANQNPNTPVTGTSLNSIFDGPFGSLASFNQGGTFQGVFTSTPSTGHEILANDANGRPTVALDFVTNDLIIGDIGIFCSGGAGSVSTGPGINNNNDKLICNIFALACILADDVERTNLLVALCPNETTTLPDGQIIQYDELGVYMDTLASFQGCDSIITTIVTAKTIANTVLGDKRCDGDGYSVTVNGHVYDEANPNGEELLITAGGCDSTVIVALQFNPHTAASISPVLCPGEVFPLAIGGQADATGIYVDSLVNFNGCDSVLTINLTYYHHDTTYLSQQLCPNDSIQIGNEYYVAGEQARFLTSNLFGCDSLVITDLMLFPSPNASIDSVVDVTNSNYTQFSNVIPSEYPIEWLESGALSCDDCPNPIILPNDGISPFHLTLTDGAGCRWDYEILVNYICNSFIPNVFSPNGDGINDLFNRFSSGCPPQEYQFKIFDRWGEEVFSTTDIKQSWDGFFRGKPATQGVYVYLLTVKEYGEEKRFAGEVVLTK